MIVRKLTLAAALVGIIAGCDSQPEATGPDAGLQPSFVTADRTVNRSMADARAATARFHDVTVALSAGFVDTGHCVAVPAGGMGVHFVNPMRLDGAWTAAEPEMLLYEPQPNGSMKLVGVEYAVIAPLWHAAGNAAAPEFAGRTFDFMPANEAAGLPPLYTLHAWVWQHNPTGMFEPFNPRVSCAAAADHGRH
jgi:hypothetical protein